MVHQIRTIERNMIQLSNQCGGSGGPTEAIFSAIREDWVITTHRYKFQFYAILYMFTFDFRFAPYYRGFLTC